MNVMKKPIILALVALVLVACICFALPQKTSAESGSGLTEGVYTYSVAWGRATITGCATSGAITIPSTLGGYPVTSIGNAAFADCTGLCSVTIGNAVTSIGNAAFADCTGLTSVVIPDSVTSIGPWAFSGCTGLTSVTIGSGVTSIREYAFVGCTGLTSIMVDPANTVYHSAGNCLIETASKTLIIGTNNSVIPSDGSVTSIGGFAFDGCTGLTSITVPNSVTSISYGAFGGRTGLTSITVDPANTVYHSAGNCIIKTASKTLIAGCKTSVIPTDDSVTSIWYWAFFDCTGLTSITIPNSVTSIRNQAFSYCTGLKTVVFRGAAPTIDDHPFEDVTATVYYPNDGTYTDEVRQNYGGTLTWVQYDPNANIAYEVKEGEKTEWKHDSAEGLTVSSAADFDKFVEVRMDGVVVSPDNYTVKAGSTVVTFKPAYLATLGAGDHTVTIVSLDGAANTVLAVQAAAAPVTDTDTATGQTTPANAAAAAPATDTDTVTGQTTPATASVAAPQTGDDNHLVLWALIAVLSLAGAGFSAKRIFAK